MSDFLVVLFSERMLTFIEQAPLRKNSILEADFLTKIFFLRFYLFVHERHRERGRNTGRGRSRLPVGSLMWDSIPGLQDHTLSRKQIPLTAEPPRSPSLVALNSCTYFVLALYSMHLSIVPVYGLIALPFVLHIASLWDLTINIHF